MIALPPLERPANPCRPNRAAAHGRLRRALFIESYPHAMYGQQQEMLAMLQRWPRHRFEAMVTIPADGPFGNAVRELDIEPILVPYPPLLAAYGQAVFGYRGLRRMAFAWQTGAYILRWRRKLREIRPAGVFCNDLRGLLTAGVAARSLGVPVMIWDKLDRPHGWLDRLELPIASVTAFISEAVKAKFSGRQLRAFQSRLHTVPDGADISRFDSAESDRQALGIKSGDVAIAVVGTITARKGQDRILGVLPQLVERVPQALVLIVGGASGSAEDRRYLESLPNREHPRVRFLGLREDMPGIMHSIDLLAVPSRHEGMGVVLVEAMACRKPVVAARTGGIQEVVVDGETGVLFDGDDQQQLLDALVALCRSPALCRKMGQAGRARVEQRYDRNTQMKELLDIFTGLLEERGKKWQ
jgi:glycosyltransferase involved in cell wall biosynthesis